MGKIELSYSKFTFILPHHVIQFFESSLGTTNLYQYTMYGLKLSQPNHLQELNSCQLAALLCLLPSDTSCTSSCRAAAQAALKEEGQGS